MGFRRAGRIITCVSTLYGTGYTLCIPCFFGKGGLEMKQQWAIILSILFAILIAFFAVLNVESVRVNYLFGTAQLPLILIILFTAFLGAAISGFMAMLKSIRTNRQINELKKEITAKEITIATQQNELASFQQTDRPIERGKTAD